MGMRSGRSLSEVQSRSGPRDCKRRAGCRSGHWETGKAVSPLRPASQETGRAKGTKYPVGRMGEKQDMTTQTISIVRANTDLLAIAFAALIGVGLIFVAGFSSAAVMHDTSHDQRHAIAFPCH